MKKILLSVVCLVMMGLQQVNAQVSIAVLHHEGNVTVFNSAKIQDAVDNPNLLLYVSNKALAPGNVENIVVGDSLSGYKAQQIVLTDTEQGNIGWQVLWLDNRYQ
ncbi:MAG: hypothetical protein IJS95_00960 [Prevotella sp.]|nr:hypothetical protein [Prevotella sp.]